MMLVLVILGVMFSLASLSSHAALEQSRADLAGANLRAIWTAERIYWLDNHTTRAICPNWNPDCSIPRSRQTRPILISVAEADAATFTATARRRANVSFPGNTWIDDHAGRRAQHGHTYESGSSQHRGRLPVKYGDP